MTREEIMERIPHRDEMLLVDEIRVEGDTALGHRLIRGDEWFLRGHFPGNPVVPGVIQCEMLAQAACALLPLELVRGATPYFVGLNQVRFKNPVRPGDVFESHCRLVRQKPPFFFAEGKGYARGELCVTAEFSFALMRE